MKIIHISSGRCNPDSSNGVEKTICNLAIEQAKLGHEVHVLCITGKKVIPLDGVVVKNFAPRAIKLWAPSGLLDEIDAIKPDIVHLHSVYALGNPSVAEHLRTRRIGYVVTPNGCCSPKLLRRRPYLKYPYRWLFELPMLNGALFVHSVGDEVAIREYGVLRPIITAPNGFSTSVVPKNDSRNLIRTRHPDLEGKKLFVFLGRLDVEQKGLDLLLTGISMVSDPQRHRMGVVLVGPSWKDGRQRLERMSAELKIQDSVLFWGETKGEEKFKVLQSADYFVHTSRWEGLSFSVLESLACGIPCLITPPANPMGLVGFSSPCGLVVDLAPKAIAEGFDRLLEQSAEEHADMSQSAVNLVKQEFSWSLIASRIVQAYQNALAKV